MNRFLILVSAIGILTATGAFTVHAAEKKAVGPAIIAEPDVDQYQKKTDKIYDQMKEISKDLSPSQQKHFYMIYSNYNLLGTVRMVQTDVGKAVDACSAANPGMESALRTRFQTWNNAIDDVMADAEGHLDNMIAAQDYTSAQKINSLFAAIDKTRSFTNGQVKKTPVTSEEACEYLRDKMDDTQKNLTTMLKQTLMSVPPEPIAAPSKETTESEEKPPVKDGPAGE